MYLKEKKNYYELLSEIDKDELLEGLVGHGLFTDKIPPFLTSEIFLNFCKEPPTGFNFNKKPKKYIHYENIRNINVPRVFGIPNPISYYNQCKVLSDNWEKLLEYFKNKTEKQSYKVSRIHIRKINNLPSLFSTCYDDLDEFDLDEYSIEEKKYLFEMNHKNFCIDDYPEPDLLIKKRYIVKADISNCFPSIYTHSLSWALVGKKEAKAKSGRFYSEKWFNQIDETTRNLKDGETHGILIGSHSFNLISEIVLVAIDEKMWNKGYEYIRNIDDYNYYAETHEKAEQFLIDLSLELKEYGLMLNHKKTEILKLPLASSEHWVRKLQLFTFPPNDDKLKLTEVRAYLDIALDLMFHNKENSAILNYAIKIIAKKEMTKSAKEYFIKTIHHLVLLYPYLIHLLEEKVFQTFDIDKSYIEKISKDIFALGDEKKLFEAMSYALYFSIKYNFILIKGLYEKVEKSNDAILLLLAYLHDKKFIHHSAPIKKYKKLAESLQEDIDEYWIFVYEVLSEALLTDEWNSMKKEKVTFIKSDFCEVK